MLKMCPSQPPTIALILVIVLFSPSFVHEVNEQRETLQMEK